MIITACAISLMFIVIELIKCHMSLTRLLTLPDNYNQLCGICGQCTQIRKFDSDMLMYICNDCISVVIRSEIELRKVCEVPDQELIMKNP